jgi:hypothetical protein
MTDPFNSPSRRRWQISLGMLLCVITIIGLSISQILYMLKYQKLKRDYDTIRTDFAVLDVQDRNLIHAIALPVFEPNTYRFRVYVPSGKKYQLRYRTKDIPSKGFPTGSDGAMLGPVSGDDNIFEVRCKQDGEKIYLYYGSYSARYDILKPPVNEILSISLTDGVSSNKTTIQESGKPLLLVKRRDLYRDPNAAPVGLSPDTSTEHGIMIWIEESP